MINLLAFCCGTYLVAITETALAQGLDVRQATPSLLALWAIVWVASRRPSAINVVAAGVVGLVFDLNSGGHTGIGVVSFAAAAFAIEQPAPRFRRLDALMRTLATAPFVALVMLVVLAGNLIAGESVPPLAVALVRVSAIAAYTAAISLPVWMCASWLREPASPRRAANLSRI